MPVFFPKNEQFTATILESYGPLKGGKQYLIVGEGHDYLLVRCRGWNYSIPYNFFKQDKNND